MSEAFDPYYKWLGIPLKDQPPNHYRLLGVSLFEPDAEVIDNAAEQRMIMLRTFQNGARAADSQKLLNEVASARGCLLDEAARTAYDAKLRSTLEPKAPAAQPTNSLATANSAPVAPVQSLAQPTAQPLRTAAALPLKTAAAIANKPIPVSTESAPVAPKPKAPARKAGKRQKNPLVEAGKIIVGGIAGLALGYFVVFEVLPRYRTPEATRTNSPGTKSPGTVPPPVKPPVENKGKTTKPEKPLPELPTTTVATGTPVTKQVVTAIWNTNDSPQIIIQNSEGFVVTSLVGGFFLGDGESLRLQPDANETWWIRGGGVKPVSFLATGVKSDYRRLFEPKVEEVAWNKSQSAPVRLIHRTDGFAVLSGVNGCFLGPEHEARVYLDPDGYWYVFGRTNFNTHAVARVYKYREPQAFKAEVKEVEWRKGSPALPLIHKDDGICFISSMSGAFRGGGERVGVALVNDKWTLQGSSGTDSVLVRAISIRLRGVGTPPPGEVASLPVPNVPQPTTELPPAPAKPGAVPPTAERNAAEAKLVSVLESKDTTKLLAAAGNTQDATEKYVLLAAARDISVNAGNSTETFTTIDKILQAFQANELDEKAAAIRVLKNTCTKKEESEVLARTAIDVCVKAELDERGDLAKELAVVALSAARKAGNDNLVRMATLHLLGKPN